jgi:ubiquinone/menaquinone biosynthesis C-methylase UbiE
MRARREQALAGLLGRVIDVGAGSGATFAHYTAGVSGVLAVEREPFLRGLALDAAAGATVPVAVVAGVAESLPVDNDTFDAGVAHMTLCSVRDPSGAAAELYRVIKPGGELRLTSTSCPRTRPWPGFSERLMQRSGPASLADATSGATRSRHCGLPAS